MYVELKIDQERTYRAKYTCNTMSHVIQSANQTRNVENTTDTS